MKTQITLFIALLMGFVCIAQNGINYKAIVRDDMGTVVANQEIRVELTLNMVPINFPAYIETHVLTTNDDGLIILAIGEGTPINGTFSSLDWLNDRFELNIQIDLGSGLIDMGSTPFYSVPYSYHAQTAVSAQTAVIATDVENVLGLEALDEGNGIGWRLARQNPDNYGPIGLNAVDLSYSSNSGNDRGALGEQSFAAGSSVASGSRSFAFGFDSYAEGNNSFALGFQSTASGNNSLAFGNFANATGGNSISLGSQSRASGDYSLAGPEATSSGDYSVALGNGALATGFNSVALGPSCWTEAASSFGAGFGHHIFPDSVVSIALGFENANRANNSVTIGYRLWSDSYQSIVLGSYNTLVSASESLFLPNDPLLQVGNGTSFSNRSTALMILKNGNVGIGTTAPQERLHIEGRLRIGTETIEDTGSNQLSFGASLIPDSNNSYRLGNSSSRWIGVWAVDGTINTSDRRDKENITELNYGLKEIQKLKPVSFNWKKRPEAGTKLGLIAQDLLEVIPEVVKSDEIVYDENDETSFEKKPIDRMGVYYSDLIPVLIKAIQDQQVIIEEQNTKLKNQDSKINGLTAELEQKDTKSKEFEQRLKRIEHWISVEHQQMLHM